MIRLLTIIAAAGIAAAGMAWLADRQGELLMTLDGYELRMSAGVAAGFLIALAAAAILAARAFAVFLRGPRALGLWSRARRRRGGEIALSRGLVAAAAGDAPEARRLARRAQALLGAPPLGLLLSAQAAQLAGDEDGQMRAYRAMLDHPETEFLGLRGLFMLASRSGEDDTALDYAARAHRLKPKAAWAANALFDLRSARGQWREAQAALDVAARAKTLAPDVAKRRRAVLLAAEAMEADRAGEAATALSLALEAVALSPALTPAAVLAARRLTSAERAWKAQDIIEAAWAQAPHPDLAAAYAAIRPDEDGEVRAKRLKGLAALNRSHLESRLLEAEQAILTQHWSEARAALAPLARAFATARVCALMAELEQGERGDATAAHGWLARAVRAPRDAQWSCANCGWTSEDWTAVCPGCGAFDSLAWTTPGAALIETLPPTEAADEETVLPPAAKPAAARASASVAQYAPEPYGPPPPPASRQSDQNVPLPRPPDDPGPAGSEAFDIPPDEGVESRARRRIPR